MLVCFLSCWLHDRNIITHDSMYFLYALLHVCSVIMVHYAMLHTELLGGFLHKNYWRTKAFAQLSEATVVINSLLQVCLKYKWCMFRGSAVLGHLWLWRLMPSAPHLIHPSSAAQSWSFLTIVMKQLKLVSNWWSEPFIYYFMYYYNDKMEHQVFI